MTPNPSAPCVWLHATTPADSAAVEVLALALADLPRAPRCLVTGLPQAPGPGDDAADIVATLVDEAVALLVLVGSSLPVTLIAEAHARAVALMLVDAVDPVPQGGWRILPGYTRSILKRFAQIHTRDAQAAAALPRAVQAAVEIRVTGPLARLPPVQPCNQEELDALRRVVGTRPVWYASGVPPDEVEGVLLAQAELLRRAQRSLLILQPLDADPAAVLAAAGPLVVAQRSIDDEIDETTQVYLADTEDQPGLFLRLSTVCYLGGSLRGSPAVAHADPPAAEAAALGSALVFGPRGQGAARVLLDRLRAVGGGKAIRAPEDLSEAVAHLLSPEVGAEAALRAWTLVSAGAEGTQAVAKAIADHLATRGRPP